MRTNYAEILLRSIKAQAENMKQQMFKAAKLGSKLISRLSNYLRGMIRQYMTAPKSREDYFAIGSVLLSKRLMFVLLAAATTLCMTLIYVVYPFCDGHLWTASMQLNSDKFLSFSGKARVFDQDHLVIYQGQMQNGQLSGNGRQYDTHGNLVYEGSFLENQYNGQGKLYVNGILQYDGMFAANRFNGQGKQYNEQGRLIYHGSFADGACNGQGMEYEPSTGRLRYSGSFAAGMREGAGIAYDQDGVSVKYRGQFSMGVYSGQGRLYEAGIMVYQGDFVDGKREGEGIAYDAQSGRMLYSGTFVNDHYEGEGRLFDPSSQLLIYEGTFAGGLQNGAGRLYDAMGNVAYEGAFRDGLVDYFSFLGVSREEMSKQFGQPGKIWYAQGKEILVYPRDGLAAISLPNETNDGYVCQKIICTIGVGFGSLTDSSTVEQIHALWGEPYSALAYEFPDYYHRIFSGLNLSYGTNQQIFCEKYQQSGYYIRVYYDEGRTKALAVEICKL